MHPCAFDVLSAPQPGGMKGTLDDKASIEYVCELWLSRNIKQRHPRNCQDKNLL